MDKIEWFFIDVDNMHIEDDMKWYLTVGLDEAGTYYCPLEYAHPYTQSILALAAQDGIRVAEFKDRLFVPMDWLRKNNSKAKPMVDKMEDLAISCKVI